MKRILLTIVPVLLALSGFSQQLQPVKLDNEVTVSLFPDYQKKDTVGQTTYSANALDGYMVVIREPNDKSTGRLKQASDLNKVLKTYIKGIQAQSANSVAENVRDTTIGSLKAKVFTLSSNDNADQSRRDFLLLYTQDVTYTFEYVYDQNTADFAKKEGKEFFSSIRTASDLNWNDQYMSQATGLPATTKIVLFGGGAALILIIIIAIAGKKKGPAFG